MKLIVLFLSLSIFIFELKSQDKFEFSGNFMSISQFYDQDDKIGANTIVYQKHKSSTDAFLFLNSAYKGFSLNLRYDLFNNSPLLNPQSVYSKQGLGFWQLSKDIENLNITAGYFYDQFGSGMVFRAYEERSLGLDYAIQGLRLKYNYKNLRLKAFTGQQKGNIASNDRFSISPQAISGFNSEYFFKINEFKFDIGAGIVNRTLDLQTMNGLAQAINGQVLAERFVPKYNVFSNTQYAAISYKDFRLYTEFVYKTKEAIRNQLGDKFINKDGNIFHSSLSYSKAFKAFGKDRNLGANVQYKRTDNFSFRTSSFENLNFGTISFLPSITRQNTYRLLARYNHVVQVLGEEAYQADVVFKPNKLTTYSINASQVYSLKSNGTADGKPKKLFHELYFEVQRKLNKKTKIKAGIQSIYYDQQRFEQKDTTYPDVKALTPFVEVVYKFTRKKSLRFEAQYMETGQDLGSFANAVLELSYSPNWTISVGDMVNTNPYRPKDSPISKDIIHYYSAFVGYTHHQTVATLAYVKQVQGVNCTGGICRVEPAFSGVRFTLSTSF